jgi:transcriptional regulator with XRE-family HTH domain
VDSRGKSINAMADDLGMTPPTLSRYLAGKRTPDLQYIVRVSQFFNVSIEWLLGLSDIDYDILPADIKKMSSLYSVASEDDKRIINSILAKYEPR